MTSDKLAIKDTSAVHLCIEEEGKLTETLGHWSSMLQVLALSNVISRSITMVFPAKDHYAKSLLSGTVHPFNFLACSKEPIVLMWSSTAKTTGQIFKPDHVVPLFRPQR